MVRAARLGDSRACRNHGICGKHFWHIPFRAEPRAETGPGGGNITRNAIEPVLRSCTYRPRAPQVCSSFSQCPVVGFSGCVWKQKPESYCRWKSPNLACKSEEAADGRRKARVIGFQGLVSSVNLCLVVRLLRYGVVGLQDLYWGAADPSQSRWAGWLSSLYRRRGHSRTRSFPA